MNSYKFTLADESTKIVEAPNLQTAFKLAKEMGLDWMEWGWTTQQGKNMGMAQRQLAASQTAQAFRNAWRLMDELIGYDASSDVAEIHTLVNIIRMLETKEFAGIAE